MTNGWQSSKKSIVVLFGKQRGYDAAKKKWFNFPAASSGKKSAINFTKKMALARLPPTYGSGKSVPKTISHTLATS
jgi:hypothetical protein